MHCGLTNASAPFQRFMSEVFKDFLDVRVVVYLADILIYFDNPGQHLKLSGIGNSRCFRLRAPVPGYWMDGYIRASG